MGNVRVVCRLGVMCWWSVIGLCVRFVVAL